MLRSIVRPEAALRFSKTVYVPQRTSYSVPGNMQDSSCSFCGSALWPASGAAIDKVAMSDRQARTTLRISRLPGVCDFWSLAS